MKRWYIVDVIGDGTEQDPQRLAIAHIPDLAIEYGGIPVDPNTGVKLQDWSLCLVSTSAHSILRGRGDCFPLPDFPLDGKMSAMHSPTKLEFRVLVQQRLASRVGRSQVDADALAADMFGTADGYRDVLQSLGKECDIAFDVDSYDMAE